MPEWNSYRIAEYGKPLELQTEELPRPQGSEVLVRISACGVCHSDVHIWEGYFDLGGGRTTRAGGKALPLTPGHEIAGEVAAAGPDARIDTGRRYVVYPWIGCGEASCAECARGDEHLCTKRALGVFHHGGFSNYVLVPDSRYLVPFQGLPDVLAATFACSGLTSYAALKKVGQLHSKDTLLIIGAGGVGMSAIRLARLVTGIQPVVADIDAAKRAAAMENGAAEAIDPAVKTSTKFAGVVDFVGAESTVRFGTSVLRKGGTLVIVGLFGGSLQMPIPLFPLLGITVRGSVVGSATDLQEVVALAELGAIGAIPYSTRPLSEAARTLADLKAGKIVGRVVLTP